jgi:hypothetical protein
MRALLICAAAFAALAAARSGLAQVNPYSGCNQAFRACWDYGAYLQPEQAQRHRGY